MKAFLFSFLFMSSIASATEVLSLEQELEVISKVGGTDVLHEAMPGIVAITVTSCYAGVPAELHKRSRPDILPEACLSVDFKDQQSLDTARQNQGTSFRVNGVLVYLSGTRSIGPEPGIAVHN